MNNCQLTLFIPTYNRSIELVNTVESCLLQTASSEIFKVVVVDNASTDDTKNVMQDLLCQWKNLEYVVNGENLGMVGNWNRCMDLVDTPYYMLIHSDDIALPHLVDSVMRFICVNKRFDVSFCNVDIVKNNVVVQNGWSDIFSGEDKVISGMDFIKAAFKIGSTPVCAPSAIFSTEQIGKTRFRDKYRWVTDLDFWLILSTRPDSRIGILGETGIRYVYHDGQITADALHQAGMLAENPYCYIEWYKKISSYLDNEEDVYLRHCLALLIVAWTKGSILPLNKLLALRLLLKSLRYYNFCFFPSDVRRLTKRVYGNSLKRACKE
jgi:glycosyltransferase involved in cell wall biosynthesis